MTATVNSTSSSFHPSQGVWNAKDFGNYKIGQSFRYIMAPVAIAGAYSILEKVDIGETLVIIGISSLVYSLLIAPGEFNSACGRLSNAKRTFCEIGIALGTFGIAISALSATNNLRRDGFTGLGSVMLLFVALRVKSLVEYQRKEQDPFFQSLQNFLLMKDEHSQNLPPFDPSEGKWHMSSFIHYKMSQLLMYGFPAIAYSWIYSKREQVDFLEISGIAIMAILMYSMLVTPGEIASAKKMFYNSRRNVYEIVCVFVVGACCYFELSNNCLMRNRTALYATGSVFLIMLYKTIQFCRFTLREARERGAIALEKKLKPLREQAERRAKEEAVRLERELDQKNAPKLFYAENYEEAIKLYRKLYSTERKTEYLEYIIQCLYKLGFHAQALKELKSIPIQSMSPEMYRRSLEIAYCASSDVPWMQRLVQPNPTYEILQDPYYHAVCAQICKSTGQWSRALEYMSKACVLLPNNDKMKADLSYIERGFKSSLEQSKQETHNLRRMYSVEHKKKAKKAKDGEIKHQDKHARDRDFQKGLHTLFVEEDGEPPSSSPEVSTPLLAAAAAASVVSPPLDTTVRVFVASALPTLPAPTSPSSFLAALAASHPSTPFPAPVSLGDFLGAIPNEYKDRLTRACSTLTCLQDFIQTVERGNYNLSAHADIELVMHAAGYYLLQFSELLCPSNRTHREQDTSFISWVKAHVLDTTQVYTFRNQVCHHFHQMEFEQVMQYANLLLAGGTLLQHIQGLLNETLTQSRATPFPIPVETFIDLSLINKWNELTSRDKLIASLKIIRARLKCLQKIPSSLLASDVHVKAAAKMCVVVIGKLLSNPALNKDALIDSLSTPQLHAFLALKHRLLSPFISMSNAAAHCEGDDIKNEDIEPDVLRWVIHDTLQHLATLPQINRLLEQLTYSH